MANLIYPIIVVFKLLLDLVVVLVMQEEQHRLELI